MESNNLMVGVSTPSQNFLRLLCFVKHVNSQMAGGERVLAVNAILCSLAALGATYYCYFLLKYSQRRSDPSHRQLHHLEGGIGNGWYSPEAMLSTSNLVFFFSFLSKQKLTRGWRVTPP